MTEISNISSNNKIYHPHCRHWRQRSFNRKKPERVVFKTGEFNLEKLNKTKYRILPDIVTAYIGARWRWTLINCVLTYIFIWMAFAALWWFILYQHGDLEPEHIPHANNNTWSPCVREIYSFTSIFLFSIEIYTTIGYGKRAITLECPSAMLMMCIESITGKIIQSLIIGIVFAKLTRPKNRAQTLVFSKNAIISQRDSHLSLIFRVGNIRKSRIIGSTAHAFLINHVTTVNGFLNDEQIKLDLVVDATDDILFIFPISVVHKIDERSPLYYISAHDMLKSDLEIIVVFEGTIESTGQPVQAKSSYTEQEILWGRRFLQPISYRRHHQGFVVDYSKFDDTYRVNTPLCTAKELSNYYTQRNKSKL